MPGRRGPPTIILRWAVVYKVHQGRHLLCLEASRDADPEPRHLSAMDRYPRRWSLLQLRKSSWSRLDYYWSVTPPPLFTQLYGVSLTPPTLGFHDSDRGTTFYSLPLGLLKQDLTPLEKGTIPVLNMLTEVNSDIMDRHRRAMRSFHEKLESRLSTCE